MGLLDKLFGKKDGATDDALDVETAVGLLSAIYSDPEVRAERGISITGGQANEVRAIGRRLHAGGGRERMAEARTALRDQYEWAAGNLDSVWSSLPEWKQA